MKEDTRSFEERLTHIKQGLEELCKYDRIEILPVLLSTPQALLAQIRFLDLDNKELLKKYGLEEIEQKLADEAPKDETPNNPLRN